MRKIRPGRTRTRIFSLFLITGLASWAVAGPGEPADISVARRKLETIRLPETHLKGTSLQAAVQWLRAAAAAADLTEPDPARQGINVVIIAPGAKDDHSLSINFKGGTLREACQAVAAASRRTLTADFSTVSFAPAGLADDLWMSPEFGDFSAASGFRRNVLRNPDPRNGAMISAGITFLTGASLASSASGRIVMRNSQPNLETLGKVRVNP